MACDHSGSSPRPGFSSLGKFERPAMHSAFCTVCRQQVWDYWRGWLQADGSWSGGARIVQEGQ